MKNGVYLVLTARRALQVNHLKNNKILFLCVCVCEQQNGAPSLPGQLSLSPIETHRLLIKIANGIGSKHQRKRARILSETRPSGMNPARQPSLVQQIGGKLQIHGLVQDYSISIAKALEILQSCTEPSKLWLKVCSDLIAHNWITAMQIFHRIWITSRKLWVTQGPVLWIVLYPWLSARLQHLQCFSNGDTVVLHEVHCWHAGATVQSCSKPSIYRIIILS